MRGDVEGGGRQPRPRFQTRDAVRVGLAVGGNGRTVRRRPYSRGRNGAKGRGSAKFRTKMRLYTSSFLSKPDARVAHKTVLRTLARCKVAGESVSSPCSASSAAASPFGPSCVGSKRLRACAVPNGDDDCATVKRCENVPSGGRYFAVGSNVGGRLASRDWATRAEPPLRQDGHPQRRRRRRRQNPSSVTWGPRSALVAERCHKTVSCTARSARRREKYIRGNEWRHRRGTLRRCFRCLTSRGRRALVRSRLQCEYGMKAKAVIPAKCGRISHTLRYENAD